jgi:RNAse (barnase) inhibitor barstar
MLKPIIEIDGSRFDTLNGFWEEISVRLIPGARWGRNFDAFNDILREGFGTPQGGFRLRWVNFQWSVEALGYPETIRWLENKIQHCHPDSVEFVKREIEAARGAEGPTLADIITDIIRIHGPGGVEEDDGIELELA